MKLAQYREEDEVGKNVEVTGIVTEFKKEQAKFGMRYELTLKDKNVMKKFSTFDNLGLSRDVEGMLLDVTLYAKPPKEVNGKVYANIVSVKVSEDNIKDYEDNLDVQKYLTLLNQQVSLIKDDKIKALVSNLVTNEYFECVGGLAMHHPYKFGLGQHIVSVCQYALKIADVYEEVGNQNINRDILIAGALLHDVGKTAEYKLLPVGSGKMSEDSAVQQHIVSGIRRIERQATLMGIPEEDESLKLIMHIVASHHGKMSMGSPSEPATLEAIIVSNADMIDFRMNNFDMKAETLKDGESATVFAGSERFNYYMNALNQEDKNKPRSVETTSPTNDQQNLEWEGYPEEPEFLDEDYTGNDAGF